MLFIFLIVRICFNKLSLNGHQNGHHGLFIARNKQLYIFCFYAEGKRCRYSTKIKLDPSEWDLAAQRPKTKRGNVGEANRKITDELNEYQSYYNELKSKFKESLTK